MQQGNGYTIGFAVGISLIVALLLSGAATQLKPMQDKNRQLDKRKNILIAADLSASTPAEIESTYAKSIKSFVIDQKTGKKVDGKDAETVSEPGLLPVFERVEGGKTVAYVYPVQGKGLWSTLYGYMAVKPDGNEIVGLTFYKHGETPGLGAEIEAAYFRDMFKGKRLYSAGKLVGITVAKGKAKDQVTYATQKDHMVDGISGATLTGNGVMKMTKTEPKKYDAFFKALRGGSASIAKPADVRTAQADVRGVQ